MLAQLSHSCYQFAEQSATYFDCRLTLSNRDATADDSLLWSGKS
jgi:hypothetical protein